MTQDDVDKLLVQVKETNKALDTLIEEPYEETLPTSCVNVDGTDINVDQVETINIEENIHGEDVLTFIHQGKQHQSLIRLKYLPKETP